MLSSSSSIMLDRGPVKDMDLEYCRYHPGFWVRLEKEFWQKGPPGGWQYHNQAKHSEPLNGRHGENWQYHWCFGDHMPIARSQDRYRSWAYHVLQYKCAQQ